MLVFDLHLRWRRLSVLATASMLAACGGGGNVADAPASHSSAATSDARPVEQTDLEIAIAVYSGQRAPDDFHVEDASGSADTIVTTLHLKNTDIDAAVGATESQFELCTDDWNQALDWSETSARAAPQYADLVATDDDARYFEFGRAQPGSPPRYVRSRVYKCAYLDRTNTNLRTGAGPAGYLNVRPIDAETLERLSEYLWQFTPYNNFGHTVLKSAGSSEAALEHTLYIASLVRSGLPDRCDRIDVTAWRHRVDPTNGAVTLSIATLWSFGARESSGVAELCIS